MRRVLSLVGLTLLLLYAGALVVGSRAICYVSEGCVKRLAHAECDDNA